MVGDPGLSAWWEIINKRTYIYHFSTSAKEDIVLVVFVSIYENSIINNMGPNTVTCGTLLIISNAVELALFAIIIWVHFERNSYSQEPSFPDIPRLSICGIEFHENPNR